MMHSTVLRVASKGVRSAAKIPVARVNAVNRRGTLAFLSSRALDSQESSSSSSFTSARAALAAGLLLAASYGRQQHFDLQTTSLEQSSDDDETTILLNWSGTHAVNVRNDSFWEPETLEELEAIVKKCQENRHPVRPLGSALSPNGIAFNSGGMVSLTNLDKILHVDEENMTVTVQAGARVSQVVDALRPYNLTLPNLASIAEQQMGGFIQVGAHGTGARIAPVDHYVTKLKLVTPAKGTMELTEADGDLFQMAKVGLGCLGVVAEVTMQVIPAHKLVEHTYVLTREEAKDQLNTLLKAHKHVRYMWIPYQDAVVVVTNDPEENVASDVPRQSAAVDKKEQFRPLTELLADLTKDAAEPFTEKTMEGMGFGELRDALLAVNPLDVEHVQRCNEAEAEFWRKSEGYQTKPSDELLQFDCGGQVRSLGRGRVCCNDGVANSLMRSRTFVYHSNGSGKYAFRRVNTTRTMETTCTLWRICFVALKCRASQRTLRLNSDGPPRLRRSCHRLMVKRASSFRGLASSCTFHQMMKRSVEKSLSVS